MARQHSSVPHEELASWLKYFDVEYLKDEDCARIAELDPNDQASLKKAIHIAVLPEFITLNDTSKQSLRRILHAAISSSEHELESVFSRIGMPFLATLQSKIGMLKTIWQEVFNESV